MQDGIIDTPEAAERYVQRSVTLREMHLIDEHLRASISQPQLRDDENIYRSEERRCYPFYPDDDVILYPPGGSVSLSEEEAAIQAEYLRSERCVAPPLEPTREQLQDIHSHVFGSPPKWYKAQELFSALEEALAKIPPDRKAAFLEARASCPLLFDMRSSHAMHFLRTENFHPERAAEKMVRYWENRRTLFGSEAVANAVGTFRAPIDEDYVRLYWKFVSLATDSQRSDEDDDMVIAAGFVQRFERSKIDELDAQLDLLVPYRGYFLRLREDRPDLFTDTHKLLFLRCFDFKIREAVSRMVAYWDTKVDLFGYEGACKPLTVEDYREYGEEIDSGYISLLPGTDASGRALVYLRYGKLHKDLSPKGLGCALWYVVHAALERTSCKRNGVVFVSNFNDARLSNFSLRFLFPLIKVFKSLPVDVKAIHDCIPLDRWWWFKLLVPFLKSRLGQMVQGRLVLHSSGKEQTARELVECGLTEDQIPVDLGGLLQGEQSLRAWLEKRRLEGL